MKIQHATHTTPGRRSLNEDTGYAEPAVGLYLVADGMGGNAAGDVASKIVAETVSAAIRQGKQLSAAIEDAHNKVRDSHVQGIGTPDMGSTIVAVKIGQGDYEIAWVGDSRAYLWNGQLKRLTRDHSVVQQKIDLGLITESEALTSTERNMITQCLGGNFDKPLSVDTVRGELRSGNRILLCSDGLLDKLTDERMAEIFQSHSARSDEELAAEFIEAAGGLNARDNVTVVVVSQTGNVLLTRKRRAFITGIVVGLIIIALLLAFD